MRWRLAHTIRVTRSPIRYIHIQQTFMHTSRQGPDGIGIGIGVGVGVGQHHCKAHQEKARSCLRLHWIRVRMYVCVRDGLGSMHGQILHRQAGRQADPSTHAHTHALALTLTGTTACKWRARVKRTKCQTGSKIAAAVVAVVVVAVMVVVVVVVVILSRRRARRRKNLGWSRPWNKIWSGP